MQTFKDGRRWDAPVFRAAIMQRPDGERSVRSFAKALTKELAKKAANPPCPSIWTIYQDWYKNGRAGPRRNRKLLIRAAATVLSLRQKHLGK